MLRPRSFGGRFVGTRETRGGSSVEEFTVGIGQWNEPAIGGVPSTASSYAGFGPSHLMVMADGAAGPMPSRLGAQAATSAIVSAFRSNAEPNTDERLRACFTDAHAAVERTSLGPHGDGRAGASVLAVVVEAQQLTVARIGSGRAHAIHEGKAVPLCGDASPGYVGDNRTEPEVMSFPLAMRPGERVVLATEPTARTIAPDLEALCRGSSPQIVAHALITAAQRRGERSALAVQVLEIRSMATQRPALPSTARLAREELPAFRDGRQELEEVWTQPPPSVNPGTLRLMTGGLGLMLGALTALLTVPNGSTSAANTLPATGPVLAVGMQIEGDEDLEQRLEEETTPLVTLVDPEGGREITELGQVGDLHSRIFLGGSPRDAARTLKRHLTRRSRTGGPALLEPVEAWVRDNRSRRVVSVLVELLDLHPPRPIRHWIRELLPDLYEVELTGDVGGDEAPAPIPVEEIP